MVWVFSDIFRYCLNLQYIVRLFVKKLFPFAPVVRLTILAEQRAIAQINWVEFCQKSIIGTAR